MRMLTKWLTPLLMLALALPTTTQAQDLTFGSATATNVNDTIPLGGQINAGWQLTNDGSNAVPQQERVSVTLRVAGDSVDGVAYSNLPLPPGQSIPTSPDDIDQLSLTEIFEASEYSEGDVEASFVVANASDNNASNDTFSFNVYLEDKAIDIGVSAINTSSTDVTNIFHDSLTAIELEIRNYGNETLKSGTRFPLETIIEFQQDRFLDTFSSTVTLDEDLEPQQTATVSTRVYASPFADTGGYNLVARTTFGQDPYSVDTNGANDTVSLTTNVDYKYNIEPRFTGLNDGDTILRGSNTTFGIDLFNEGPGFVRSFEVQTQQGNRVVPLTINEANFGIDSSYSPQTLQEDVQLPINLQVNGTRTLAQPGDLPAFRLPPNDDRDSVELSFYHISAVPSRFITNLTNRITPVPTLDTNRITLYVEDKNFDIGVTNISPVGDTIEPDPTNEFEVTITNFSSETIGSNNSIPVTSSFKGNNNFETTDVVSLDQDLPGNDSVTVTINLDLTDIAEGEQTLVMETIWSLPNAYGLDNNADNDADSVVVTVGESDGGGGNPEGIAESSLVKKVKAYPNPADENVRLSYTLQESNRITVNLVNVDGKQVRTRQEGLQTPGSHNVDFNVESLSAGTYFYQIRTEEGRQTGQVVVK